MVDDQPTTPPKHRTAKGAKRLQDLISVAAELFLDHGYEGVAVDDLIARVGGSRSNVYSHFGGKEGLFKEAMISLCAEVVKPLEQLNISGEPDEVLTFLGQRLLKTALMPHTLALNRVLVNEGRRFPNVAQAMWDVSYGKAVDILTRWIAGQQQLAEPTLSSALPAKTLAQHFIGLVVHDAKFRAASGLAAIPLPDSEVDEIVNHAVRTFLYGASTGRRDCGDALPK